MYQSWCITKSEKITTRKKMWYMDLKTVNCSILLKKCKNGNKIFYTKVYIKKLAII